MLLTFSKKEFVERIKDGSKIHTIREDKHDRWKVGNSIQFWSGNPRNVKSNPFPFGTGFVKKVITISISSKRNEVYIDWERYIDIVTLEQLAKDDGFENWEEMKKFFPEEFFGKLIFWEKCEWKDG